MNEAEAIGRARRRYPQYLWSLYSVSEQTNYYGVMCQNRKPVYSGDGMSPFWWVMGINDPQASVDIDACIDQIVSKMRVERRMDQKRMPNP